MSVDNTRKWMGPCSTEYHAQTQGWPGTGTAGLATGMGMRRE